MSDSGSAAVAPSYPADHAAKWVTAEETYSLNSYDGGGDGEHTARYTPRGSSVLLVALHAVNHFSKGAPKVADRRTGGLVDTLGSQLGLSVLSMTSKTPPWDSWEDRKDDLKGFLLPALTGARLVIDLHGMSNKHDVDICVGMGPKPGSRELLVANIFAGLSPELKVSFNKPFAALEPHTATAYLQRLRFPAIQVEIAATFRDPVNHPVVASRFYQIFGEALTRIEAAAK